MKLRVITLFACLVLALMIFDAFGQVIPHYDETPDTLSGFLDRAAAVIYGRVEQKCSNAWGRCQALLPDTLLNGLTSVPFRTACTSVRSWR